MKKVFLAIVFIFLLIHSFYAQEMQFKHITSEDGLLSNHVDAIVQDSDGFMWFGTMRGLCRYDGYTFLNFTHSITDSLSLSNNNITSIVEDKDKNLWIGTLNGLNMIERETYQVRRLDSVLKDFKKPLHIHSLMIDDEDKLWIGTNYSGLLMLNLNTFEIINYRHSDQDTSSIISNTVFSVVRRNERDLLIATNNGLDLFDPSTQTFKHILPDYDVRSLSYYPDSSVFVGIMARGNYYYKLSPDNQLEKKQLPVEFSSKQLLFMADSDGNQWTSIRDNGLIFHDDSKNIDHKLLYDKSNETGINSNAILSFYEDRLGNIWIGTFDAGINVWEKGSKGFIHVKDNNLPSGLQNNRVRSMYVDSDGDIWIGTKVNGSLGKFDRDKLTFTHYRHDPNDPHSLSNDFIFCITEDRPGYLWVGTNNGLNLFEKSTGKTKQVLKEHVNPDMITPDKIRSESIKDLLKDGDSLYIGHAQGMDIYDTKRKTFIHFTQSDEPNSLTDRRVNVIFRDSQDYIWIGTMNGLNRFNKKNGEMRQYLSDPTDSTSISESIIQCIHEDKNGNLWIGTSLGINLFNREDNSFTSFTTQDGLPANSISGILEDDHGNLWISTNKGLSKFNPSDTTFINYNVYDGLQANEFGSHAFCKTKNGEMLFGGNNGFNIFHPDSITENTNIPNVVLTNFKLNNKDVPVNSPGSPLKKHITRTEEITLTHKQSVMTFEYVALNFTSPENNQYAYMMEGFEDEWNYVGSRKGATYTNLDPGDYIFRVKGSNNDGLWNEEGVSLKIEVLPAPWKTWWAYLIYCVILLSMFWAWIKYYTKMVKDEKEHELDQQKLQFFVNVSHEFRTPLTLILNPIDRIISSYRDPEEVKDSAITIQRSARRLLSLVNQLLDFRKLELGKESMQMVKTDIIKFTKDIYILFKDLANEKEIQFQFLSPQKRLTALFDVDKFEKIITNLLSNAIKFTDPGGSVTLFISKTKQSALLKKDKIKEVLEIRVIDTGKGFKKKQLPSVFDRFLHVDNPRTGTGIGLNYTKYLVELHGGIIKVESEYQKGSTFIIHLPLEYRAKKFHQSTIKLEDISDVKPNMNSIHALDYEIATGNHVTRTETRYAYEDTENENRPLILIVEDKRELRIHLKKELEQTYKIREASNGAKGLEIVNKYYPDVIISDVMMPKMDGFEMCTMIKSEVETCHIPIILLTARALDVDMAKGYKTGADAYIPKPFSMDVLKARIINLLESRKRLRNKFTSIGGLLPSSEITSNTLDEAFLDNITTIVLKNISNPDFNQDRLLQELGCSKSHLYRKINVLTGTSPSIFIRTIRLKYASELLIKGNKSIKEIAYLAGFNSATYFGTTFRELYGVAPVEYADHVISNS